MNLTSSSIEIPNKQEVKMAAIQEDQSIMWECDQAVVCMTNLVKLV